MYAKKLADDLTELETRRAALVAERERAAGELEAAREQLASAPTQGTIDAATVTQSRHAALANTILVVDGQIVKVRAALALAEPEEAAKRERQRLAEVRAERERAEADFNRAWEEAHASLLAHLEQIAQHRARFVAASRELGVRADIKPPGMLLNHSVQTALDALTSAKDREAQAARDADSSRRRDEREREVQAAAERAAREVEEDRIRRWQQGGVAAVLAPANGTLVGA